jgi:hypothetical protein
MLNYGRNRHPLGLRVKTNQALFNVGKVTKISAVGQGSELGRRIGGVVSEFDSFSLQINSFWGRFR